MKIPVTQELIERVRHEQKGGAGWCLSGVHAPCLTEVAVFEATGVRENFSRNGYGGCIHPGGNARLDDAGVAYINAYDEHLWDDIQPGEFEYIVPEDE